MRILPDWISIGYITGAHGIQGDVRVVLLSDRPEKFDKLKKIKLESSAGEIGFFNIEKVRRHGKFVLVKFEEIETRDSAMSLKGASLQIKRESCPRLPADEFYHFELIGLVARSSEGLVLGKVVDILDMPANDIYVISDGKHEYLIPAVKQMIKKIDLKNEEMIIQLIEGLID
ncbi:16S rRNA processing protein RimM [candidate division KSB1 bacterium]|nr:16S rRNA processing protein RimM [candidate division KSB1 bacterium]